MEEGGALFEATKLCQSYVNRYPCKGSTSPSRLAYRPPLHSPATVLQLRALVQQSDAKGVQQKTASPYTPQGQAGGGKDTAAAADTTTVSSTQRAHDRSTARADKPSNQEKNTVVVGRNQLYFLPDHIGRFVPYSRGKTSTPRAAGPHRPGRPAIAACTWFRIAKPAATTTTTTTTNHQNNQQGTFSLNKSTTETDNRTEPH